MTRLLLLLPLLIVGCASAVQAGSSAVLGSKDLVSMSDRLALDLASDANVREAEAGGVLRVVVEPVQNRLRGEVIPTGQRELFTARLRDRLEDATPGRFVWVNNKAVFERLVASELDDVRPGPVPGRVQPTHTLKGVFRSLADETKDRRVAYYLCSFDLVDLADGRVIWTGQYEVKKAIARDYLD